MRILIVSHEYPPVGGGGANACMFLADEYIKQKNEVVIVTVWFEGKPDKEVLHDGKLIVYYVKSKRKSKDHSSFPEMLDYLLKALPVASSLVKSEKYDICQVFFGIPSGPIGYYLKKKYKVPYVIRFGGGDIPGFQERFKVLYKLIGVPLKVIWNNADALVANSAGLKKFALDFYNKCKVDVIHNGVDTEVFQPKNEDRKSDCIRLLFVSRLIERKGLQSLIPFLDKIKEDTGKNLHLTIVGDGPYRVTLEEMVKEANVEDMVSFEGQKDKVELLPYYNDADVFVFPSKREGMPNAVLEAMACGLPVVMMRSCEGSAELIDTNGLLVDNEFYLAVEDFIRMSENERKKMGIRSREKAVEEFSWSGTAKMYLNLFDEIDRKVVKRC